jgi:hypothetical protein
VIRTLGPQPIARHGRLPYTLALAALLRRSQPLLASTAGASACGSPPSPTLADADARDGTPTAGGPLRTAATRHAAPHPPARRAARAAASSDADQRFGTPAAPTGRGDPEASEPPGAGATGASFPSRSPSALGSRGPGRRRSASTWRPPPRAPSAASHRRPSSRRTSCATDRTSARTPPAA